MKIADFSVKRPVTISMIMVVLLLLGAIAVPLLKVDLYPNLTIPVAVVTTSWQGASPEEVEKQLSKPIESAMATVSDVNEVDSTSRQNASLVVVRFNYGVDLNQAMLNIRDKLDRVRKQLPTDADQPTVNKIDPNSSPIMTIALSGPQSAIELERLANDAVSPKLETAAGVASTSITGGSKRQIQVQLDPTKLQAFNLSSSQVVQAIQSDNTSGDGGLLVQGDKKLNLHIDGDFTNVNDISNVPIHLANGATIYVKDIASVEDTFADTTQFSRVNNQQGVSIDILKSPDSNTVQVSKNVRQMLNKISSSLPKSVKLTVISDQATFIQQSINTVIEHTLIGAALSIIVLYMFLQSIRTTLIIGIVIPISIISTFSLMYFSNQTINTVTLGGLALGMGSLVDFAVVVIESIFRYRNDGHSAMDAARLGTAEVGTAVLASALSQIAVFAPIAFTQGLAVQLFGPLALTVSFSHLAALFGALTLVPMLASRLVQKVDEGAERKGLNGSFSRTMNRLNNAYRGLLKWALGHRKTVVIFTIAIFAASMALIPLVGFELAPNTDQGQLKVNIQTAVGSNISVTNNIASQVEAVINRIPEVDTVFTQVGGGGNGAFASNSTNRASITVQLKPLAQRKRSTDDVVEEVRQKTAGIAGAKINASAASTSFGRGGSAIDIDISGQDDKVLQSLSNKVEDEVSSIHGTRNIQNSLDNQIPQYNIQVDRERAAQYGLTVGQIVTQVRNDYQGVVATGFHALDSSIDVLVEYPEAFSQRFENLNRLTIVTPSGAQVALSDVASINLGTGPAQISRTNQTRTVTVSADLFNANQGLVQQQVQAKLDQLPVPDGYTVSMGGQTKDMSDSFKSLGLVMPLAIILVYMVMASQFESLFSPFIIMFSMPPTLVGALIGLVVTHRAVSINALIGAIMLIGIVVNNAIVLVDYTNQLRERGLERNEAILQAGPVRLRPILMTTATTVLAMLPLVLGVGEGAEAQAPMATVVAFGLTFSTLVTLVLIPVVYAIFDDFGNYIRRFFRRGKKNVSQSTTLSE
jgi:hydrophobic/amphiphilic exporter-1 (mainly G- bacteria), HAE1 family